MIIYFNSYVVTDGYTLKRTTWPQRVLLEEIKYSDMPEGMREVFLGRTAPFLFLGTVNGVRFGCVRNMETNLIDENGRCCYNNIAFEEESDDDIGLIGQLISWAYCHRGEFVRACFDALTYKSGDFQLDKEKMERMIGLASGISAVSLSDLYISATEEDWEEWCKREIDLEMYLYCSTPSYGFVLSQIDVVSGQKLRIGDTKSRILSDGWSILTNSGASAALFVKSGICCLVIKGVQSEANSYGRKKSMSVIFQAPEKSALQIRQLAAWMLIDFPAFSKQLTDCVEVYDGNRGYEVKGAALCELLDRFREKIFLPDSHPARDLWNQIVAPTTQHRFDFLILDSSIEYFGASTGISVSGILAKRVFSAEEFRMMCESSQHLVFTPELYITVASKESIPNTTISAAVVEEQPIEIELQEKKAQYGNDDIEALDLLQTKWFLPCTAGLILALVAGIGLYLYFRLYGR